MEEKIDRILANQVIIMMGLRNLTDHYISTTEFEVRRKLKESEELIKIFDTNIFDTKKILDTK